MTSPRRRQLVTCASAARRLSSPAMPLRCTLRRRRGAGDDADRIGADIGLTAQLVHHNWIEAAPFSAISMIGIRLEPRIGAASRMSSRSNGNSPSLARAGKRELAMIKQIKHKTYRQHRQTILLSRNSANARKHAGHPTLRALSSMYDHAGEHVRLQHHQDADQTGEGYRVEKHETQDRTFVPKPVGRGRGDDDRLRVDHFAHDAA